MSTITWLHLSDFHLKADKLSKWDQDIVLRSLLEDVQERIEVDGLGPDFIVVSGDIAFKGVADEYALARVFFDELLEKTDLGKARLFVVPGNHDVNRDDISFMAGVTEKALDSREAVAKVLEDGNSRRQMFRRLDGYAEFVRAYFGDIFPFDDENYFYVRSFALEGQQVAILGLNSAWVAHGGEEDYGELLLSERQVRQAVDEASGAGLKLAVLHHPFGWLKPFDRKECMSLLMGGCDFILRGHLHQTDLTMQDTHDTQTVVLAAGASYQGREKHNAYNIVRFDLEARQGTAYLRMYSDQQGGFWTNDAMSYKDVKDGEFVFRLSEEETDGSDMEKSPTDDSGKPADHASIDPARLEAPYLRRVQTTCNALPLHVIDPRAVERTRQRTMELLAVYVALNTQTPLITVHEKGGGDEAGQGLVAMPEMDRKTRLLSALACADMERQAVLLGDPGSGKSTFMDYLAICLAGGRLEALGCEAEISGEGWMSHLEPTWSHGTLLPLQVTLREFSRSRWCNGTADGLWQFIVETLRMQSLGDFAPYLREQLVDGEVLVLLDGLDEVAEPEKRQTVREAVEDFTDTYGGTNRYLVTCRGYAYQEPCDQLVGFADHALAPFDQEQIDSFVACWYEEVCHLGWKNESEARELTGRLRTAVRRQDLADLAGNPLQLTMMASLHSSWGRLPDDRVELYQEMVRLLLFRWQESRLGEETGVSRVVSAADLESALEQVGFEAHSEQGSREGAADINDELVIGVLRKTVADDWGQAGELMAYIQERAGLLIEKTAGIYTFPHRSYQEYLAGAYLARQPDFPDQAAALAGDNYPQWREVVLWAVGVMARLNKMPHVAVDVVAALCPHDLPQTPAERDKIGAVDWRLAHLGGEALLEIGLKAVRARERHHPVLDRVQRWLKISLWQETLPPVERAAAGRVLGKLGDDRPGVTGSLRVEGRAPLPDMELCYVPAGAFWLGEGESEHLNECLDHAYWMGRYPVTNAQFRCFVEDQDGYREDRWWTEAGLKDRSGPVDRGEPRNLSNHPVGDVTWYEALAYTRWLADRMSDWAGRSVAVRLPSDAEWEKSARGGLQAPAKPVTIRLGEAGSQALRAVPDGPVALRDNPIPKRRRPWGGEIDANLANYDNPGRGTTSAVGCFPGGAGPYGCEELSGNVWEWTRSIPMAYPYGLEDRREDLEGDDLRVLRGGWIFDGGGVVHGGGRYGADPRAFVDFGLRVVVAPI